MFHTMFIALALMIQDPSIPPHSIPPIEILNPKPPISSTFPSVSIFHSPKNTYIVIEYSILNAKNKPSEVKITKHVDKNSIQIYKGKLRFSNTTNSNTDVYELKLPSTEKFNIGEEFRIEVLVNKEWKFAGYTKVEQFRE